MAKPTKAQFDVLHALSLRPNGGIVRGDDVKTLLAMCHAVVPWVSDVYEMTNGRGWYTARISQAGRAALHDGQAE